MNTVVYVLGNDLVSEDSAAVSLLPELTQQFPDIQFVHIDPTEGLGETGKHPTFIDAVVGIDEVTVFDSLNAFSSPPRYTAHDYDLFSELSLLQKIGKIESFTIIGIPTKGKATVWSELSKILQSISL